MDFLTAFANNSKEEVIIFEVIFGSQKSYSQLSDKGSLKLYVRISTQTYLYYRLLKGNG